MRNKSVFQPHIVSLNRVVLLVMFLNFFVLSSIYYVFGQPKYPYYDYLIEDHIQVLILASMAMGIFSFGRYFVVGWFSAYKPSKRTIKHLIPPGLSPTLLLFVFAIGIAFFLIMITIAGGWSRILQHEGVRAHLLKTQWEGIGFGYFYWPAMAVLFSGGALLGARFLLKGSNLFSAKVLIVAIIPFLLWSCVFNRFTAILIPLYLFLFWFQISRRLPARKYIASITVFLIAILCYVSVLGAIRGDIANINRHNFKRIVLNALNSSGQEILRYTSQGQEIAIIANALDRDRIKYFFGGSTLASLLGPFARRIDLGVEQGDSVVTKFIYDRVTGVESHSFSVWISMLGQALLEGGLIGMILFFFVLGVIVGLYDCSIRKIHFAAYLHPFVQLATVDLLFQGTRPIFKYCVIGTMLIICANIANNLYRRNCRTKITGSVRGNASARHASLRPQHH